jgi:DNA-binding CsgD family transcriptional regulator
VGGTMCDVEWLGLAADLVSQAPARWPGERIALQLTSTFRAVGCAFDTRASDESPAPGLWPPERFNRRLDEIRRWSVQDAPTSHPILRYYLATGDMRVMQVDDVPERVAPARLVAAWVERGRDWGGVQNQLALPLVMIPQTHRAFVVGRPDPFTEQEMELARQLHRLLTGLDHYIAANSHWVDNAGRDGTCIAEDLKLTPRELAVLTLATEGLTAASIGRRLTIAERTVHKHLEHTYAKLGVADRLSAVLRAQRIGLLRAN